LENYIKYVFSPYGRMMFLLQEILQLKRGVVGRRVSARMGEFKFKGSGDDSLVFGELCFCILTANFQAEKSIIIQESLRHDFESASEACLASLLRIHGHRFPNVRANFIVEARKHKPGLLAKLKSFNHDFERRLWLVSNIKGIGMKEASHFLRNTGFKDCAIIDFHIIDKLAKEGVIDKPRNKALTPKRYLEIEEKLGAICSKTSLSQAELDLYLWYAETGKVLK
jgi:N-glycosylase/DNA lyase